MKLEVISGLMLFADSVLRRISAVSVKVVRFGTVNRESPRVFLFSTITSQTPGSGFTIARLANYLAVQGDNLVVGRMLGPARP